MRDRCETILSAKKHVQPGDPVWLCAKASGHDGRHGTVGRAQPPQGNGDTITLKGQEFPASAFQPPQADGGGIRHNAGKLRVDLVPADVIAALAEVLGHACTQRQPPYPERNWERGMNALGEMLREGVAGRRHS